MSEREQLLTHRCTLCLTTVCKPIFPWCPSCGHILTTYSVTLTDD